MALQNESLGYEILKHLLRIFFIIFIIGCIVFRENLLKEMSYGAITCLVLALVYFASAGKQYRAPLECEIRFYDEYFTFEWPKWHYGYNKNRREWQKMYYKDVTECIYRINNQKWDFFGKVEEIHWEYDKAGVMKSEPNYHRTYEGIIKFYAVFAPDINFKEEIQKYTPIQIVEHNS